LEQGEHRQRDQEKLKKQEETLPKSLPETIDVKVFNRLPPEIGAGDFERLATEFKEIEGEDRQRQQRQRNPQQRGVERVAEEGRHTVSLPHQPAAA
jgi:hypothetical protein